MIEQAEQYRDFYRGWRRLRWAVRFDVHYRVKRLREVLRNLGISAEGARVLDVGFGSGQLLRSFPRSCRLVGADVSQSAVDAARRESAQYSHASAEFVRVSERDPEDLPQGPFDFIVSSHSLEHMPDDRACLAAIRGRLRDDGLLVLFVPIEEPDYIRYHLRNYSVQSIRELVDQAGFDVLHCEGNMHVNGHVWKLITIPSRREWKLVGPFVDALRLTTLSALTYRGIRTSDAVLEGLGAGARQAFIIARRRPGSP